MWFVNDNWQTPSAYCYQPSTEGINGFKTFVNQDGTSLVITYVRCVAEDKNGDMWIGTNQGPLLLEQSKITEKILCLHKLKFLATMAPTMPIIFFLVLT